MLSLPVIIIAFFFILGYLFMLVSIITQPIQYDTSNNEIPLRLRNERIEQSKKIKELQLALEKQKIKDISNPILSTTSMNMNIPYRPGVIILGMHRSGTSILGGLINKMGLKTGGPLITPAEDNEKGFFERIDVVLQNDEFMKNQNVHYGWRTHAYDNKLAIKRALEANNPEEHKNQNNHHQNNDVTFYEGQRALHFLNNPINYPWMLKDPRLCITLRTWLPLLSFIPTILFTYRHPMDVALSLNKRAQEHYGIGYSLKIWYIYNRRAIEQSIDLCRIITSHHKIMKSPETEFQYLYNELKKCGVTVPKPLTIDDIHTFIDVKLQHGKNTLKEESCDVLNKETLLPPKTWETDSIEHIELYRQVMKLYCAMEDLSAFQHDFKFDDSIVNE